MTQTQTDYSIHLECRTSGPTGGKFWIAAVCDRKVTVRWGPIGKTGQSKEYEFGNPFAALKFVQDKEDEKRGKGYYQVTSSHPPDIVMETMAKKAGSSPTLAEPAPVAIPTSNALSWDF